MLLVFSAAGQFGWDVAQFDVAETYMLTVPSHLHCVRYPPRFCEYLARPEGVGQFDSNAFLPRLDRSCYGAADARRVWYGTLAGFLRDPLELKIVQIDRCVFVRHKHTDSRRSTCVILVYVDDLLVFGSTSVVSEPPAAFRARFPLTGGASDTAVAKNPTRSSGLSVQPC